MEFRNYIYEQSEAEYSNNILLIDEDNLEAEEKFSRVFADHGFEIVIYTDDLQFRISYEEKLNTHESKLAVIAQPNAYIPYDIRNRLTVYHVSYEKLFPKLNSEAVKDAAKSSESRNLILRASSTLYETYSRKDDTEQFIREYVFGRKNVRRYAEWCLSKALDLAKKASNHKEWFEVANLKASIDVISAEYSLNFDTNEINQLFQSWVLLSFGKQSSVVDKNSPVLVRNAMEFMAERSNKFAIIVMDGMSEFDWNILSRSFTDMRYAKSSVMAMIPSVTSVSRQSLLSGKFPFQLEDPWHQAKEKKEFVNCADNLGFKESQIEYKRGYNVDFDLFTKCGAVIIMDIDENVHGQKQGRMGMFNDVSLMAKQHKLADLTKQLLKQGFDVYISADHGNTVCTGIGKLIGSGLETETKSHRMIVMKDFADKERKIQKYGMVDYPKYYLPKENDYLICNVGESFDIKDEEVMTHGGITIDEVIVPFVMFKAEDFNG